MAEGTNAAASGALGIGLTTLMWTLDKLGVVPSLGWLELKVA